MVVVKRKAAKPKAKAKPTKSKATKAKPTKAKARTKTKLTLQRKRPVALTREQALVFFGGSFPVVKGSTHAYPKPTNGRGWTKLLNDARLAMYNRYLDDMNGRPRRTGVPYSKYEYILFHQSPRAKQKRAIRNKHRKEFGLKKGDPREVHHHNQTTMSKSSAQVLTKCQHKKAHGKRCIK